MITLHIDKNHAVLFDSAISLNDAAQNQLIAHALDAMSWDDDKMDQALGFINRWDKEKLVRALCRTNLDMVEDILKTAIDES